MSLWGLASEGKFRGSRQDSPELGLVGNVPKALWVCVCFSHFAWGFLLWAYMAHISDVRRIPASVQTGRASFLPRCKSASFLVVGETRSCRNR